MVNNINGNSKPVPHQLWCQHHQKNLTDMLWPNRLKSKKAYFLTSKTETAQTANQVLDFVIGAVHKRFSVEVEQIIATMNDCKEEIMTTQIEANKCRFWELGLKGELMRSKAKHEARLTGLEEALHIVVNTVPEDNALTFEPTT